MRKCNSIEYLDMEIARKGRDIKYSRLRKDYISDKVINYFSGHHWKQKYSIYIYMNLADRAFSITNHKFTSTAIRYVQLMECNAYPSHVTRKILTTIIYKKNLIDFFQIIFRSGLRAEIPLFLNTHPFIVSVDFSTSKLTKVR